MSVKKFLRWITLVIWLHVLLRSTSSFLAVSKCSEYIEYHASTLLEEYGDQYEIRFGSMSEYAKDQSRWSFSVLGGCHYVGDLSIENQMKVQIEENSRFGDVRLLITTDVDQTVVFDEILVEEDFLVDLCPNDYQFRIIGDWYSGSIRISFDQETAKFNTAEAS